MNDMIFAFRFMLQSLMNKTNPGWDKASFESGELICRPSDIISGAGGKITIDGKTYKAHVWAFEPRATFELKKFRKSFDLSDLRN